MQIQLKPEHLAQLEHEWDLKSVEWELTPDSVVVEIGAYKGRWASIMCDLYGCRIYAFEPQMWALTEATKKFDNCKPMLFNYALGERDAMYEMGDWGTDGCSLVKSNANSGLAQMQEIRRVFQMLNLKHIDVMLINIEGYEYTLIPHMARIGLMPTIDNLMVQFHNFAGDEKTHNDLLALIGKTHQILWDYGTTLTAWTRND